MLYINISNYAGTHMRELLAQVVGQTLHGQVECLANALGRRVVDAASNSGGDDLGPNAIK